jgi:hypothetical protein
MTQLNFFKGSTSEQHLAVGDNIQAIQYVQESTIHFARSYRKENHLQGLAA